MSLWLIKSVLGVMPEEGASVLQFCAPTMMTVRTQAPQALQASVSCSDAALFCERQAPATPAASSKAKLEGEPLAIIGERGPKGEKFFHLVQVR